jgi:hypothetical protein
MSIIIVISESPLKMNLQSVYFRKMGLLIHLAHLLIFHIQFDPSIRDLGSSILE